MVTVHLRKLRFSLECKQRRNIFFFRGGGGGGGGGVLNTFAAVLPKHLSSFRVQIFVVRCSLCELKQFTSEFYDV